MDRLTYVALLMTLFSLPAISQKITGPAPVENFSALADSLLDSAIAQKQIPGAVLLVSKNGKIIHHKAYGYAQLKSEDGTPLAESLLPKMTTEHLFDIASLTKVVGTTTGILFLYDKGLIKLDDAVGKYISGFSSPEKSSITVRHLLTHTSGLYDWYPLYYRARNRDEVYKLIASMPLAFPIGQQRKYSDLGFTILGQLIEVISKKPLEVFLHEEVFKPLGMNSTLYNPKLIKGERKYAATSIGNPYEYRMVHDSSLGFTFSEINPTTWNKWRNYNLIGEVNDGNAWYAGNGISGAAGLFSTAADINQLAMFWLNRGQPKNTSLVQESSVTEFLKIDQFKNGLGWMMDSSNSFMKNAPFGSFGHTGFTGTSIAVVPSKKMIIVLLINRQQVDLINKKEYFNVNSFRKNIFKIFSEQEFQP